MSLFGNGTRKKTPAQIAAKLEARIRKIEKKNAAKVRVQKAKTRLKQLLK